MGLVHIAPRVGLASFILHFRSYERPLPSAGGLTSFTHLDISRPFDGKTDCRMCWA